MSWSPNEPISYQSHLISSFDINKSITHSARVFISSPICHDCMKILFPLLILAISLFQYLYLFYNCWIAIWSNDSLLSSENRIFIINFIKGSQMLDHCTLHFEMFTFTKLTVPVEENLLWAPKTRMKISKIFDAFEMSRRPKYVGCFIDYSALSYLRIFVLPQEKKNKYIKFLIHVWR